MIERIWVLGAADPEMNAIERLLVETGETVIYAQILEDDGSWKRVNNQNAYDKSSVYARLPARPEKALYLVECKPNLTDLKGAALRSVRKIAIRSFTHNCRIVNHQSENIDYGLSPEKFLLSSSIGDVISTLAALGRLTRATSMPRDGSHGLWLQGPPCLGKPGEWILTGFRGMWSVGEDIGHPTRVGYVRIPRETLLIAACNHCLKAAYANECPGVYRPDVKAYRAKVRAQERKCSEDRVLADIEVGIKKLQNAPRISCGNHSFADMRGSDHPELLDAGADEMIRYLTGPVEDPLGRKQYVCSGNSKDIEQFFSWANDLGMAEVYDDRVNGVGRAYLP
jgi:hypothetical protein